MKISVIIPAAGQSERFGSKNKLDEDLGGRPLLQRTVELFRNRDEIVEILVAAPPESIDQFKFRYGDTLAFHGARIVEGGTIARWETVKKALVHVADDVTHITVHDAARPAVSTELLDRVFEAAQKLDAVIPAVAIHATVKRLGDETVEAAEIDPIAAKLLGDAGKPKNEARPVIETLDRNGLVEVQTPQVFKADVLRRAYEQNDLDHATDDAALVERLGETVHAVEGDRFNIKVTTPADVGMVRKVLNIRPPKDRPTHKRF